MVKLSKRGSTMIGKLSELLVSGHRAGFFDMNPSPMSPLDLKAQSPPGLKRYDFGGVGLGIVAALENYNSFGREVLAKCAIASTSGPVRSDPIPAKSVASNRFSNAAPNYDCDYDYDDEDYTFVTRRGPNNETVTRVYYDGGLMRPGNDFSGSNRTGIFSVAAAGCREESCAKPNSDFLSSCHLCKKNLHGKDIFMYRGEKAFCSSECRSSQMMMDERKEQCRSEASKSVIDVSSSSYSKAQILSTGIFAI